MKICTPLIAFLALTSVYISIPFGSLIAAAICLQEKQPSETLPSTQTEESGEATDDDLQQEPGTEAEETEVRSGALVDSEWIEANADPASLRIIGLGQTVEQYGAAHIPGEVFVDWKTEIASPENPDQFNLPSQEQIETLLSRLGVTPEMTIVISDNMSSRLSARMFWTLRCYGHADIRILDGGRRAWVQSGRDFTTDVPEIEATEYRVSAPNPGLRADLEAVRQCANNEDAVLIDSRVSEQFSGTAAGGTFHTGVEFERRGHIPSARNVAWPDNFGDDGKFRSADELRELYSNAGVDAGTVITYCNEGIHATAPWFVMTEILGYEGVQVYDASMAEWSSQDNNEMETSDEETSSREK